MDFMAAFSGRLAIPARVGNYYVLFGSDFDRLALAVESVIREKSVPAR
jgi:hypothetical protein